MEGASKGKSPFHGEIGGLGLFRGNGECRRSARSRGADGHCLGQQVGVIASFPKKTPSSRLSQASSVRVQRATAAGRGRRSPKMGAGSGARRNNATKPVDDTLAADEPRELRPLWIVASRGRPRLPSAARRFRTSVVAAPPQHYESAARGSNLQANWPPVPGAAAQSRLAASDQRPAARPRRRLPAAASKAVPASSGRIRHGPRGAPSLWLAHSPTMAQDPCIRVSRPT